MSESDIKTDRSKLGAAEVGDTRPRILIINDESDLLEAAAMVLEDSANCKVEVVSGAGQVERDVARIRPDLILLDWVMPGIDGGEVLRRLRRNCQSLPPIIVMSALSTVRSRALALGAKDFLPKPFDADRLISTVRSHLGGGVER